MTVTAELPLTQVTYAGGSLTIPFAWRFMRDVDVYVTIDTVAQVLNTDYTVSGAENPSGGSITLLATPADGAEIEVRRVTILERQTDYIQQFLASQVNRDFDRLWMAIQEAQFLGLDISITVPPGEVGSAGGLQLPPAAERALTTLTFDADGDILLILTSQLVNDSFGVLPVITTLDEVADTFVVYDDSASAGAQIVVQNAIGKPLGDGRWHTAAGQVLAANIAEPLELATALYDALERGAFSTSTYAYTAAEACRIEVTASVGATIANGEFLSVELFRNGVAFARGKQYNEITSGTQDYIVLAKGTTILIAGDVVTVSVTCSGARTLDSDTANTFLEIKEIA